MKKSELRQIIREELQKITEMSYTIDEDELQTQVILGENVISKGLFKGYKKYKSNVLIPLNIKNIPSDFNSTHTPKLTVGVGLSIQSDLPRFKNNYFDIELINNKLYLSLTPKGKLAIKVRTENDSGYLDKVIKTFNKHISNKI